MNWILRCLPRQITAAIALAGGAICIEADASGARPVALPTGFAVDQILNAPVIGQDHPDAKGNGFGFEDGMTVKIGGVYHLIVCEMTGDPLWVKMRIAHWSSPDSLHWHRLATLRETSGLPRAQTGLPYESVWGSNAIYDERAGRWDLFYVGYDSGGATGGRIRLAVSDQPGRAGIGGPYRDVEVIFQPGAASQPWEGDQGTDSFYPFRAGGRWLAFYGSHDAKRYVWPVGLAEAPALGGPWRRLPEGNPLPIEPLMVENPIVTELPKGGFVAVYDTDVIGPNYARELHSVGFSVSADGLSWSKGGRLVVQPEGPANWSNGMRTPLGLVPEGHGEYTLLYTAQTKAAQFWAVGRVRVKIQ